MMFYHSES